MLVVCPAGFAATQPIPGPRPFGASASSVQKRSRRFCVEPRPVVLIPPWVGGYITNTPELPSERFLDTAAEGGGHIYVHYQLTNFFWDFSR